MGRALHNYELCPCMVPPVFNFKGGRKRCDSMSIQVPSYQMVRGGGGGGGGGA